MAKLENGGTTPPGQNDSQAGANSQGKDSKDSAGSASLMSMVGLAEQLDKMEREDEDPHAAAFAGNFGKLLRSYLKEKGE